MKHRVNEELLEKELRKCEDNQDATWMSNINFYIKMYMVVWVYLQVPCRNEFRKEL